MSEVATATVDESTQLPLDGLCIIGTIKSVEPVKRTKGPRAGEIVDGLAKCIVTHSLGEERVDLARTDRSLTGSVDLPAYTKLIWGAEGRRFIIRVGSRTSLINDVAYTNYVAIDAAEL